LAPQLFAERSVFVTGGGSGINLGIAKSFAALGAAVAICGRSQERLDGACAELREFGRPVFAQSADVRDYAALESAIAGAAAAFGRLDVLVCGAAGNFPAAAEAMSANAFKAVIDIDLLGAYNASRAAFAHLKTSRGCIIFISAGQAFMPHAYQAHVGAAKAGIDMLMKNLALEWGVHGIRANSIAPGPIGGTEGMRRLAPGTTRGRLEATIPLRRFGTVEDIGGVAAFLASPLAAYVTGTVLVADGGSNLGGSGRLSAILTEALTQSAAR
jgi:NAD(P)-dependent dehydrogenase (short-subunit alcohol dehydrogenase family)